MQLHNEQCLCLLWMFVKSVYPSPGHSDKGCPDCSVCNITRARNGIITLREELPGMMVMTWAKMLKMVMMINEIKGCEEKDRWTRHEFRWWKCSLWLFPMFQYIKRSPSLSLSSEKVTLSCPWVLFSLFFFFFFFQTELTYSLFAFLFLHLTSVSDMEYGWWHREFIITSPSWSSVHTIG